MQYTSTENPFPFYILISMIIELARNSNDNFHLWLVLLQCIAVNTDLISLRAYLVDKAAKDIRVGL